jgi:hypothetical protein
VRQCTGTRHEWNHACVNKTTFSEQRAEDKIIEDVQSRLLSDAAIAEGVKALKEERAKVERTPPTRQPRTAGAGANGESRDSER